MSSVEENKAVVRRLFEEVFDRKKPEVIEELLADGGVVDHNKIIFTEPDNPGGMAEGIRMLLVAFPDLQATVKDQVGEADYVSAYVIMTGTNTGSYPPGWVC